MTSASVAKAGVRGRSPTAAGARWARVSPSLFLYPEVSDAMRIMGLDVGDRRIGVAVSDPEGILASSLTVVKRVGKKRDAQAIVALAEAEGVGRIVVGLPLLMDGSEGEQARKVREFVQALSTRTSVPIEFWDERYTTVEAERLMREAGRGPAQRREWIDAVSAAVILQSYLDSQERGTD